jgi:hypothetical protein
MAPESHAGTSSFFQFFTRFLYGEVASKSLKNTRTFYFVRKTPWGISEPPGVFCIAKNKHKNIGGSKSVPWRCGLFIVLTMKGQPSNIYCTVPAPALKIFPDIFLNTKAHDLNFH